MSHYLMTPNERRARRWARLAILSAANRSRRGEGVLKPFTMRHIQEAVCKVRRFGLVKDKVLVAAGYNPVQKPMADEDLRVAA